MGKFNGVLLCSDFDNTLYSKGVISDENAEAIKYFQSEGGLFTLTSGRFARFFNGFDDRIVPNTYVIGLNGAEIYDAENDRVIYRSPMPASILDYAVYLLENYEEIKEFVVHGFEKAISITKNNWDEIGTLGPISKLLFLVDDFNSDRMKKIISRSVPDGYTAERSWINGIEVLMTENIKGRAVRRLKKILGDGAELTVCAGDYENDISMIKEADIGYAVANALPSVKAAADRVTVACNESAIAKIISDLENDTINHI